MITGMEVLLLPNIAWDGRRLVLGVSLEKTREIKAIATPIINSEYSKKRGMADESLQLVALRPRDCISFASPCKNDEDSESAYSCWVPDIAGRCSRKYSYVRVAWRWWSRGLTKQVYIAEKPEKRQVEIIAMQWDAVLIYEGNLGNSPLQLSCGPMITRTYPAWQGTAI